MGWDIKNRIYWDVGEKEIFNLTQYKLASVMKALLLCQGRIHGSMVDHKSVNSCVLIYRPRDHAAVLRISLPEGSKEDFERISGMTLTEPPMIMGF